MLSMNTLSLGSFIYWYMLMSLNFLSLVPYAELKTQNLLYIFNKQIKCKVSKIKILPPTQFLPKPLLFGKLKSVSCSVMSDYLQPHGL